MPSVFASVRCAATPRRPRTAGASVFTLRHPVSTRSRRRKPDPALRDPGAPEPNAGPDLEEGFDPSGKVGPDPEGVLTQKTAWAESGSRPRESGPILAWKKKK